MTVPLLPCRNIDEIAEFYAGARIPDDVPAATAPTRTSAAPPRGPAPCTSSECRTSTRTARYGSCLVPVDDIGALHRAFADGMRTAYGKVLVAGVPRMTRRPGAPQHRPAHRVQPGRSRRQLDPDHRDGTGAGVRAAAGWPGRWRRGDAGRLGATFGRICNSASVRRGQAGPEVRLGHHHVDGAVLDRAELSCGPRRRGVSARGRGAGHVADLHPDPARPPGARRSARRPPTRSPARS